MRKTSNKQTTKHEWSEKKYPKGMSRITSKRSTSATGRATRTETSTFTKGWNGATTRTDETKVGRRRTSRTRTNNY